MSIAEELQRIAEEAGRLRNKLGELSLACAELRRLIAADTSGEAENEDTPRKLQSVS
jgi:hypothetical protein